MNTLFVNFTTLNYTNRNVLSGFALPGCNFTFIPELVNNLVQISSKKITWSFGDGTYSTDLTASHQYNWPGLYNISLVVYDVYGDAYMSTVTNTVSVYDFIDNTLLAETHSGSAIEVPAGQYTPFDILRRNSWQTYSALSGAGYTINLYVSGSLDPLADVQQYNNDAWSHLYQQSYFFKKLPAGNSVEYTPISSISTSTDFLYVNLNNLGEYQLCNEFDSNAIFAGTSGVATVYFTSNKPKNINNTEQPLIIFCNLDSSQFQDQFTFASNYFKYNTQDIGYINIKPIVFYAFCRYNPAVSLSVSTNGIDSQGDAITNTFDIPVISWQNTRIPFIIKLKDTNNFSTLFYPQLSSTFFIEVDLLDDLDNSIITNDGDQLEAHFTPFNMGFVDIKLISNNEIIPCEIYNDLNDTLPSDVGGYFKGYFVCPISATNVVLAASALISNPAYFNGNTFIPATSGMITGASNSFNIYSNNGVYNITKINENFDMQAFFNTLRLPEYLADKDVFFDQFLGSIFGNSESPTNSIGKTLYEKIANFVNNNSNLNTANINALLSLCTQYGINTENISYNYPPELRRLVDLLSIKRSQLFGNQNVYNRNFSFINSSSNIGDQISNITGSFSANETIIAYEKYSNTFSLIKMPLSGYNSTQIFYLSDYNTNWGLGLIVPNTVSGSDIGNYYNFFQHTNTSNASVLDSVINWSDPTLTLSFNNSAYSTWAGDNGIIENTLNYEITNGLKLFLSAGV